MGKKKRGHPDLEELLAREWCYYCERDFDDLKILISHQKAKHFKCERCGRRLNTAGGLSVHMNQVHKETLSQVDNALPNRASLDVEIFGMEGIPEDVVQAHNNRIIQQFYTAEADRRAATGNPGPGAGGGGVAKKPKFESPSDLKRRLAEHKARMAEQAGAGGGSSEGNTPTLGQSPNNLNGSPYATPQVPYGGPQGASFGPYSQEPYTQPTAAYQQPYNQPSPYSQGQFNPQFPPPQQFAQPHPFPGQGFQQTPPNFPGGPSPGPFNAYQPPPAQHSPPPNSTLPSRPPNLPAAPGLPQRPSFSGPTAPPTAYGQGPPPPHQGNWGGNGWNGDRQNPAMSSAHHPHPQGFGGNYQTNPSGNDSGPGHVRETDDIDEIIRMAEAGIRPPKRSDSQVTSVQTVPQVVQDDVPGETQPTKQKLNAAEERKAAKLAAAPEASEKKSKKDKDKPMKMVYSDNDISPEEKMAKMPRYAFVFDDMDKMFKTDTEPNLSNLVLEPATTEIIAQ